MTKIFGFEPKLPLSLIFYTILNNYLRAIFDISKNSIRTVEQKSFNNFFEIFPSNTK